VAGGTWGRWNIPRTREVEALVRDVKRQKLEPTLRRAIGHTHDAEEPRA
jgi:hypothetical protein